MSITDPRATVKIIKGIPIFNHLVKLILCPYFIEMPTATTPALEPISVPLPPRSAPNAKSPPEWINIQMTKCRANTRT